MSEVLDRHLALERQMRAARVDEPRDLARWALLIAAVCAQFPALDLEFSVKRCRCEFCGEERLELAVWHVLFGERVLRSHCCLAPWAAGQSDPTRQSDSSERSTL